MVRVILNDGITRYFTYDNAIRYMQINYMKRIRIASVPENNNSLCRIVCKPIRVDLNSGAVFPVNGNVR